MAIKMKITQKKQTLYIVLIAASVAFVGSSFLSSKQTVAGIGICPCSNPLAYARITLHPDTNQHITDGFEAFQEWMGGVFFENHVLASLKPMTSELATVTKQQEAQIGKIYDAKQTKEVARTLNTAAANTKVEFHTSERLCEVATQSRSLNASKENAKLAQASITGFMNDRLQVRGDTISATPETDYLSRSANARSKYIPRSGATRNYATGSPSPERVNNDINFHDVIYKPRTIDMDYADGSTSKAEEDVNALMMNMFPATAAPIPTAMMVDGSGNIRPEAASLVMDRQQAYVLSNLAVGAFTTAFAPKAKGAPEVADNFHAAQEENGVDRATSEAINGETPSLAVQEASLARAAENPDKQAELAGEGPTNIKRQQILAEAQEIKALYGQMRKKMMLEMTTLGILAMELRESRAALANEINQLNQGGTTL